MLRLKNIEQNHQNTMKEIQDFLNDECEEMRAITNLLLETDVNQYGFLPENFANVFETSSGFASLLHVIHHALVDDGDISFPVVNGEPRIRFVSRWEDNYEQYALNETEKHFKRERGKVYNIKQCKDVFDFIEKFNAYDYNETRRCFISDAARRNIDFAVEHYSRYVSFDPNWEFDEQILKEIENLRQTYIKAGLKVKND